MTERKHILKIRDLSVSFRTANGIVKAVRGLNMDVYKGETVAIVGESGSGKSVTVKEVMGIHASNESIGGGSIEFTYEDAGCEKTVDLLKTSPHFMQNRLKGKHIAMVFQDPMTSLDPTMPIGKQIMEGMMPPPAPQTGGSTEALGRTAPPRWHQRAGTAAEKLSAPALRRDASACRDCHCTVLQSGPPDL